MWLWWGTAQLSPLWKLQMWASWSMPETSLTLSRDMLSELSVAVIRDDVSAILN